MGFETALLRSLQGTLRRLGRCSGDALADTPAHEGGDPLNELANSLNLQGMLIAHLAMNPDTSAELIAAAPHAGQRVPAWMELRVFGAHPAPMRMFALGCAQMLAEQRTAIERIVDDQFDEPELIEEILAEYPVPTGEDGESVEELIAGAAGAFHANFQACLAIARDLDEWIEEELGQAGEALDEE